MLIDSHCHLDAEEFEGDRAAVIERAQSANVLEQIVPAIHAASWPKLREVCAQQRLHAAYGLHPMYLAKHQPKHLQQLRNWIESERPVAVGECGLDYYIEGLDRNTQQEYFEGQVALAIEFNLPLIVHARRAVDAVIATLKHMHAPRGVVHSFSGSAEQAKQLWNMGFMIGLGGPVTYERANRLRSIAATMPLEHLLLETDAPDQPDADNRGQRNEPGRLPIVCDAIAALRCVPSEEIAKATSANARRLFGLAPF